MMQRLARLTTALALVLGAGMLMSCDRPDPTQVEVAAGEVLVRGAGATFPQPLYERWIGEYRKINPAAKFVYEGVGSGEGIKRFIAEEVDFGASDAAMKDSEIERVDPQRGVHLLPMTAGMIVLAYNIPGFEGELKLPRDVYADIMLGNVYRWDDPRIAAANPGADLPSSLIQVVARRDGSGTTFAFTNHLAAISGEWREKHGAGKVMDWPGGAMVAPGNEGVAQRIKITNNSIGYMEYGFARRLGLPMASLQNKAGEYVSPTARSGQQALAAGAGGAADDLRIYLPDPDGADAYPIVTYTWLLAYRQYPNTETAKAVREAVQWGLDSGQAIAEEMGYIPLPSEIRERAKSIAETIN